MTADAEALRERIAGELIAARVRTSGLTDCVDDDDLIRQHSPLMSPLVWDLAHIANQEELWLLRTVGGREPMHPEIDPLYDAFEHPRAERPTLPLLPPADARRYASEVRGRVLDLLGAAPFTGAPLVTSGFAFGMIAQHEQQHDETMLITHQLRRGAPALAAPPPGPPPPGALGLPTEVFVPGGPFTMGTSDEPWALDNERPAHQVDVAPFFLDTVPVTNAGYTEFIADGGYDEPRWWSRAGWEHRQRAGLAAPLFWRRDGSQWVRTRFGVTEPVPPAEPVLHVSWYEADAYARWAGRRLPTEAEWEKAARLDPVTGVSRRYPWGDAPARAGAGQPGPAAPAAGPGGLVSRGRGPVRGSPAHRRRMGVDRERFPALSRVLGVAVPRVLRGVLRPRVQGAARRVVRGRPGGLPRHVPQLGLPGPPPDLRRVPHRPRRRGRPGPREERKPMTGLRIERLLPPDFLARALREDARAGLTATPKSLPPKWFYDATGSALFEKITELPEYYPTSAERAILRAAAGQIAAASRARTLVELGSGSSDKTRLLLDALRAAGTLRSYVPVDVSETALAEAGRRLLAEYPGLSVHAMVSDFEHHLGLPPGDDGQSPRMIAFLGSTIGNMLPASAREFLARIRATAGGGDTLLLGTDLVKDPAVLVAAYDDPAGVTAAFNKNVLAVLNAELGADFDLDAFEHVALWDARAEWIEMRLRSSVAQQVRLPAIGLTVGFAAGEEMRTEVSAKFRREGVEEELAAAGFALRSWWTDPQGLFGLSLSEPA